MQVNMKCNYTSIKMTKIQNADNSKCWWGCGAIGSLIPSFLGMQNVIHFGRQFGGFLKKTKHTPTIWSKRVIYPKELKTYLHTKKHIWIFIAALFIIAKTWKQKRCPSVGEWIYKLWYIQTMDYHSVLKINELSSHEKTRRKRECILLSERSQHEKSTYCMIPTIWHSGKGKTIASLKISGIAAIGGRGQTNKQSTERILRSVKKKFCMIL